MAAGSGAKAGAGAYAPPSERLPAWLEHIDWDAYQSIKFRADQALWLDEDLAFQVRMFHLGLYYRKPVVLHEVVDGRSYPIEYSRDLFEFGPKVKPSRTHDLGFAGFRVAVKDDFERDMFAFLGASYFRAVGKTMQYGLSARGLAVNAGKETPEEFPDFRAFWLERPAADSYTMVIHALLDSPSIAGAYSFAVTPGEPTVMQVESHLFPRIAVERLGIAPMTSMFLNGENDRRVADDFRPEIHDCDGLAMRRGSGEWIWRPLRNPSGVLFNAYADDNPRGFGLLQRDRVFDHYQDDGAYYDKRPSLWIEPVGDWGKGEVILVEIPAKDETFDNVVAFWHPAEPVLPGQHLSFSYRMYWGNEPPAHSNNGEVVATRIGLGGVPGDKLTVVKRKFVIDFRGGRLAELGWKDRVEPVISASEGRIEAPAARPFKEIGGWRCNFDLVPGAAEKVNLRVYLRDEQGAAVSETWLYQWSP
ncbi:glucan biosynthesis protein [Methylogaea oryzae]|uniref:glucan biosynthesis protein n=1 Tax=Methylogaea oryzae TaxID=1295382 RepID=UPI0020CFFD0C|nr:glucan biosynthesis protein D [Methylogaea oryzae]